MAGSFITTEDIEIMSKQDNETLAKWNCKMNSWGWPDELADEPNDHGLPSSEWKSNGRRSQLMGYIEGKVGRRLISWEWNKERMTEEEFNDFFAGTFEGDEAAKTRYEKRLTERVALEESESH